MGKTKGVRSRKTIVHEIASEVGSVILDGKPTRDTILNIVLRMLSDKSMTGDVRSSDVVEEYLDRYSSRPSDMQGDYLAMPEKLSVEEWIAQGRERNAQIDRDIEASGAKNFIEYLDIEREMRNDKTKGVDTKP